MKHLNIESELIKNNTHKIIFFVYNKNWGRNYGATIRIIFSLVKVKHANLFALVALH